MTKKDFMREYGDIEVKFISYERYVFKYASDDRKIIVNVGGSPINIYYYGFSVDTEPVKINKLDPISAYVGKKYYEWDY